MRKWFLSLFLLSILLLNGEWIELPQADKELLECSITEDGLIRIEFNLDGYEQEIESVNAVDYYKISYINEDAHLDVSKYSIPEFSRLIAVNEVSNLSFPIIGKREQVVNNVVIYPSQELSTECQQIKYSLTVDEPFHHKIQLVRVSKSYQEFISLDSKQKIINNKMLM